MPDREIINRPLQRAGQDMLVRELYIPSRDHRLDVRLFLGVDDLERMLDVARRSTTRRAVMHHATVKVSEFRGGDGHVYSALTIIGADPVPEDPAILVPRRGESGGFLR